MLLTILIISNMNPKHNIIRNIININILKYDIQYLNR